MKIRCFRLLINFCFITLIAYIFSPICLATANLATNSSVIVSSENISTSQLGIKAIDGVIDGYPSDYTKEWVTVGELAGAWIKLTWSSSQNIDKVILHDRISSVENITSGILLFSDGTSINVGTLPNNGTGLEVTFVSKSITWLKFTVSNAVGVNVGLAEIEVYGTTGNQSVLLNWNAVTANSDGTSCNDLAGYKLYYSFTHGGPYSLLQILGKTSLQYDYFVNIPEGTCKTYYFVVTAFDTVKPDGTSDPEGNTYTSGGNNESGYSNEAVATLGTCSFSLASRCRKSSRWNRWEEE